MATTVTRINITIPKNLFEDLKREIPKRSRSKVITDALQEKISRIKREEGLKKLKGVWVKAGGPDFKSDKEVSAWRKGLWASTNIRLEKRIRG